MCERSRGEKHKRVSLGRGDGTLTNFLPLPFRGKLEKERKEKTKQLGLIRTEGSDGAEDMERERRTFQLQMCEVGISASHNTIPRHLSHT